LEKVPSRQKIVDWNSWVGGALGCWVVGALGRGVVGALGRWVGEKHGKQQKTQIFLYCIVKQDLCNSEKTFYFVVARSLLTPNEPSLTLGSFAPFPPFW